LPTINCMAELTATEHVAAHRYTFDTDKDAHIFIDSTSTLFGGYAKEGAINVNYETGEITGEARLFVGFSTRYDGLKSYFTASFNKPFYSFSTWAEGESVENRQKAWGDDCGADLNFGNIKNEPLEMKLAISFVSVDNARQNMQAQAGELDFEGVRAYSRDTWDSYLSRIDIETDDEDIKTIFYTSLYHSMTMPTTYTDVNGEYLGFNRTIGMADGFTYYSDMSLWDTYRNTHPLYILIAPELQHDCLKSLLSMAEIGGTLPRWPSGGGYTGSMFGTPCDMVFAESYLKGITDFDVHKAFHYMKLTSDGTVEGADNRSAIEEYNAYGYVPADSSKTSVSRTLEYAWADGSIALLAQALGETAQAEHYKEKSLYYKNIFDEDTKYFRGKNSDGTWVTPFSPDASSFYDDILGTEFARPYCEGSARHWRWSVVQDVDGLIELFGSQEYFVSELNEFMENSSTSPMALDSAGGFWIGNEHNLHAPYLFNNAKRADLTQKWVRKTLSDSFGTGPHDLAGNDDGGALSSWYVWSAIGLYPAAGTELYWVGSPNVNKAVVNLSKGKTLTIIAKNQSPENIYVKSAVLNGEKLESFIISHSQIKDGGTLIFTMSSSPSENYDF
ncbi:MAG TPA: GH92 family glycosyl hydrolase, partial [Oscillospiraceae bacterium]|nr:GH92 family glycosyl hydrolase [Oscillospiraceae bacterium]